jgi:ADP-heptose:LPS heptosyltransferase
VWGFATQPHYEGANWSRWLANVELPNLLETAPEWEKFMGLVRPLGAESTFEPQFYVPPEDKQWAEARWKTYGFRVNRPVIGFYLGGNPDRPERLWPAAAWVELVKGLLKAGNVSVIAIVPPHGMISGSGHPEPGVFEEFTGLLGQKVPAFQDSQLTRVAAFLSHLNLFICPDGGLMHIAIAAGVPTLGLCFQTDPDRWVPPVPWAEGLRAADARTSGLPPETVLHAVQRRVFPVEAAR